MLGQYLPLLALLVLAALFAAGSFAASGLLAPRDPSLAKRAAYECGIIPSRETPERFPVRFFLVAMIFIVFDIEVVFMYPWAVIFRDLGWFGLAEMGVFVGILSVGLAYVWRVGALAWE